MGKHWARGFECQPRAPGRTLVAEVLRQSMQSPFWNHVLTVGSIKVPMNTRTCSFLRKALATVALAMPILLWAAGPVASNPQAGDVEPRIQLVVHAQGAGSNAVNADAAIPTGVANVDYYNYIFATGSGQRQFGTNEDVREENISAPLGLDSQLVLSSQAADGGAQARSEVTSVIRKSDRALSVIGTAFAQSNGPGATAFAKMMLGVVVTGPSTVRIDNCALFEQDVLSGQTGLSRERGSCSFQASGDAAQSVDPQGIPIPASARDGQFIMFKIDIEQGGPSGKDGKVNGGFAIEILPGAGKCALVVEGPGTSPVEGMAVADILNAIPNIIMYTRTDRDLELIQGEIDIGLSSYADEEAHAVARAAADNLGRPVDADLRLEFNGPAAAEGLHTVSITPRNGNPRTLDFYFAQPARFQDLEAFIHQVVEAVRGLVEGC